LQLKISGEEAIYAIEKTRMNSREIGDQIRRLRREKGISQIELAEKLNISFQQVQKYENGKSKISVDRIFQIVEVLSIPIYDLVDRESFYPAAEPAIPLTSSSGVSPDSLHYDIPEPNLEPNLEYSLIGLYRALPDEETKKDFLEFLETLAADLQQGP
jgi:transcriptional regulator with XRE-family HTH domain